MSSGGWSTTRGSSPVEAGSSSSSKADIEMPPGTLIFEDPPVHTIHRRLLSRVFTPKRVAALEPQIRDLCARSLDPLVGAGGFGFLPRPRPQVPMRVIRLVPGVPPAGPEG